jgi:hypothetical protein
MDPKGVVAEDQETSTRDFKFKSKFVKSVRKPEALPHSLGNV